jgi:N-acetylmuramoyl-L-alanine amidase
VLPDFAAILRLIDKVGDALAIRPLRRKSQGEPVVMVQRRLADLGFNTGNPDGRFGWRTLHAVRNFQRVECLMVDGVVGRKTWERMWGVED